MMPEELEKWRFTGRRINLEPHLSLCWLVFVNLTQNLITFVRKNLKKMLLYNWSVGKSVGDFLG